MVNAVRRTPSIRFIGKRPPVKFDPNSRRNAWASLGPAPTTQANQFNQPLVKSAPTQLPTRYQRRQLSEAEIQAIMVCVLFTFFAHFLVGRGSVDWFLINFTLYNLNNKPMVTSLFSFLIEVQENTREKKPLQEDANRVGVTQSTGHLPSSSGLRAFLLS